MTWLPIRALVKRPGTSSLATIALALGIGLTTTMFSIVDGVFLRGLPFERGDRIMFVGATNRTVAGPPQPSGFNVPDFLEFSAVQRSFEELAASAIWDGERASIIGPDGVPMRYRSARITPNVLRVLRAIPLLGRGFNDDEGRPGGPSVVLVGERVWRSQFQADPDILGRTIRLNDQSMTVVGVMPASFGFPQAQLVWMPLALEPGSPRSGSGTRRVEPIGRLRDGVSREEANAELAAIAARLESQFPENKDRGAAAMPYIERQIPGRTVVTLTTMLLAVFGVLLVACVNVANLQLARGAERAREVAIRFALGASRFRIVRHLLVDGLLLSSAGAILGLGLARLGVEFVTRGVAHERAVPFWIVFGMDTRVLLFATGLTVVAALASSLVPALRLTRAGPNDALKDEGRATTSLRRGRFSRLLVVSQIALSFSLLLVSGLVIKSIAKTSLTAFPFRTDLLAARLEIGAPAYAEDAALRGVLERIRERAAAIPGVSGVTFARDMPGASMEPIEIEGQPAPVERSAQPVAEVLTVGGEYFDLMMLKVDRGRAIGPDDREGAPLAAVVSADFVTQYFQGQDALGRRFRLGRVGRTQSPWWTIVGITPPLGNLASSTSTRSHNATAILSIDQRPTRYLDLLAASAGDPIAQAHAVRRAIAEIDQSVVVDRVTTVVERYKERVWPIRVFGGLFSVFGAVALVLAAAGLYGVMAFGVRQRTAEIGIRMALGADQRSILSLVLRQGAWMLAVGFALGAGLGVMLSRRLKPLLFNVDVWDTPVFVTAVAVLVVAGLAATLIPARRAATIDPLVALRQE